jgi:hypothetical protein
MTQWTRLMLMAAVCLCALAGTGTVRAQIAPAAAEELMRLSGLWKQLDTLVVQVQGGMDQGIAQAEAQGAPPHARGHTPAPVRSRWPGLCG